MKRTWFTMMQAGVALSVLAGPATALAPAHFWSRSLGGTSDDVAYSVAVDRSGNVVVAGWFLGTANFGGTDLTSAGLRDVFVARYSAGGAHQWSARFGGTSDDYGYAVAVDRLGNVFVTGYFYGTANFGGSNLVSAGSADIFLAKYTPGGVHQWSFRVGSTSSDFGQAIAVDAAGGPVVTGIFAGTVNFGGGNVVSAGGTDAFLAKYDAGGGHLWSRGLGGTSVDYGNSVAIDPSGNVLLTGYFMGTANFGGANLTSAGSVDIFLAKHNASGVHQWSQRFGGISDDYAYSVAADGSGNVMIAGFFRGTSNFGGADLVSAGQADVVLARYGAGGTHQWSQRFGGLSQDYAYSVAADAAGYVMLAGHFLGTADFGGGNLTSAGSSDLFLARYSSSGAHQWSYRAGGTSGETETSLAVDSWGNIAVAGYFGGTANFGGADCVSAGGSDGFLAKYGSNPGSPIIQSIVDVRKDQGRKVRIQFARSGYDSHASPAPVATYEVYRREDALPAAARSETPDRSQAVLDDGWVYAGRLVAHGSADYLIDLATDADSTITLGQHYTACFIRATTPDPFTFFDSAPDSGYSLDNLAPAAPTNLVYFDGDLNWDESSAADFNYFTVYGSNTNSFATATVVTYASTGAVDVGSSPYVFYFITATDFSGNEGPPTMVNTLSGTGGTPKSYVLSVTNFPNPFNPRTTVSYTVPTRAPVTVAIYDIRGTRIATLVDHEERAAGAYRIDWNGRDAAGAAVSSGVYLARIEQNGATRSKKMVMLK